MAGRRGSYSLNGKKGAPRAIASVTVQSGAIIIGPRGKRGGGGGENVTAVFPVSEISVALEARELLLAAGGGGKGSVPARRGNIRLRLRALRSGQFCTLSPRHAWTTPAPMWGGTRSVDVCSATLDNALNRTRITLRTIDRSLFNKRNRDCTHVPIRSACCSEREGPRGTVSENFQAR